LFLSTYFYTFRRNTPLMKIKFVLFSLMLSFSSVTIGQSSKYDIVLFGNSIGSGTSSSSKTSAGNLNYKLVTSASANVLFKERTSHSDIEMEYKGDVLQSCKMKREKDGEWQDIKITYENGKHYFVENGKKYTISKPVTFTSTQLFFKEPIGVKEIYIERLNVFTPIVKEAEGVYKTVIDGGDNYYKYEKGVMVEFRLKKGISVFINKV